MQITMSEEELYEKVFQITEQIIDGIDLEVALVPGNFHDIFTKMPRELQTKVNYLMDSVEQSYKYKDLLCDNAKLKIKIAELESKIEVLESPLHKTLND